MYLADSKFNAIVHFRLSCSVTLQGGVGGYSPSPKSVTDAPLLHACNHATNLLTYLTIIYKWLAQQNSYIMV